MANPENMWIKFFTDAGLPPGICATYALTFTENRIQMNMLLDLNKEYLREMGIICMGDVIAILRHAKHVHEEIARNKVLGLTAQKVPIETVTARTGPSKISFGTHESMSKNQATHVKVNVQKSNDDVDKRLGEIRTKATKRKILPPDTSDKSTSKVVNQLPIESNVVSKFKKVHIDHHDIHNNHSLNMDSNKAKLKSTTNVFARLGSNDDTKQNCVESTSKIIPTMLQRSTSDITSKNVFSRLGGKTLSAPLKRSFSTSDQPKIEIKDSNNAQYPKKLIIKSNGKIRMSISSGTMNADRELTNIKQKLPIVNHQRKSVKFSPHIDFRVIERRPIKNQIIKPLISDLVLDHIKPSVIRDVKKVPTVKARLGKVNPLLFSNNIKKVGVFSRLGVSSKQKVFKTSSEHMCLQFYNHI